MSYSSWKKVFISSDLISNANIFFKPGLQGMHYESYRIMWICPPTWNTFLRIPIETDYLNFLQKSEVKVFVDMVASRKIKTDSVFFSVTISLFSPSILFPFFHKGALLTLGRYKIMIIKEFFLVCVSWAMVNGANGKWRENGPSFPSKQVS